MSLRPLVLIAALLAACAPAGTSPTPGASTRPGASTTPGGAPSPLPSTVSSVLAQGDFVPTVLTLKIDGKAVDIQPRGFVNANTTSTLGASLGTFRGEKAGARELYGPSFNFNSLNKAIHAADLTSGDLFVPSVGLNHVKSLSAATYLAEGGTTTVANVGTTMEMSYTGPMKRAVGADDFAERIYVELVAKGIPNNPVAAQ